MGMFPYECPLCGGGESRCANIHRDGDGDPLVRSDFPSEKKYRFYCAKQRLLYPCIHGQFCWEDKCVFVARFWYVPRERSPIEMYPYLGAHCGTYSAYGKMEEQPDGLHLTDRSKTEYIEGWYRGIEGIERVVVGDIYCRSCFESLRKKYATSRQLRGPRGHLAYDTLKYALPGSLLR